MTGYAEYTISMVATSDWKDHIDTRRVKQVVEDLLGQLGLNVCQSEVLVEKIEEDK